jgi:hypothetical protein
LRLQRLQLRLIASQGASIVVRCAVAISSIAHALGDVLLQHRQLLQPRDEHGQGAVGLDDLVAHAAHWIAQTVGGGAVIIDLQQRIEDRLALTGRFGKGGGQ